MANDTTNLLWGPIENLRTLIATAATYQTLVGATGSPAEKLAAAKATIYAPGIDSGIPAARPFSAIDVGQNWSITKAAEHEYVRSGSLFWLLEADVPEGSEAIAAAADWFYTQAGDIVEDMLALGGIGGYLSTTGFALVDGPSRSGPEISEAEGDFYQIVLSVAWGL